jgi:hypothetical protein
MLRKLLTLGAAALLAGVGVARADAAPRPPPPASFAVVPPVGTWTAPKDGGLCLDREGWTYVVEVRRYYEVRIRAAEQVAESHGWTGAVVGFAAGAVVAGAVAAWVRR